MSDSLSALQRQVHEALASREDELIELHRALVRFPTINRGDGSPVGETALAEFARDYLRQVGIEARVLEGAPGRGNLLAEIGSGGKRMLWMSHSDVVPPGDESAWSFPPFSAELDGGRIYGRGSNDCKMLVAAQLFALACLARLGLPAEGRLALGVGADEEVGGELGYGWLMREHPDFLRADLAICEGGGDTLGHFGGERPVIGVSTGDKGRYNVEFRVTSEGGHACAPWQVFNPMSSVLRVLQRLEAWQPRAWPVAPAFVNVAGWLGMGAIDEGNLDEAIRRMAELSAPMGVSLTGQSRMTLTPTMLNGGDKANQIPTELLLTCDSRLLPGQSQQELEDLAAHLCEGLRNTTWTVRASSPPSVSPWDAELQAAFEAATEATLGRPVEVIPMWCIGATDARFVRGLGTPVYGYQLVHPDADTSRLDIHCIDESIEAGMLLPCAQGLAHFAASYFSR